MKLTIFLKDLSEETLNRIRWARRYELAEENGNDPEQIDDEDVDDWLNRNNVGIPVEL